MKLFNFEFTNLKRYLTQGKFNSINLTYFIINHYLQADYKFNINNISSLNIYNVGIFNKFYIIFSMIACMAG